MSYAHPWRRFRLVAAAAVGTLAATTLAVFPAHAAATGTIAITSPASGKLAAETAKQVATITVSGANATPLTEDTVASIGLGPAPCNALTTYVVVSTTVVTVKTPDTCVAGTGDVVINFANSDTLTKTNGVTFVAPPAIALLADKRPVINDNSVALATADQARRFSTGGGQIVRVKAADGFTFSPATSAGLSASMGGKAGTEVKVYATEDSTTPLAPTGTPTAGNAMTFKTAAGMTAGDNTITITQNGVSKTFLSAAHLATVVAAPTVTSLSVKEGKANATGITTIITGTGFGKSLTDLQDATKWLVKFCGLAATVTADTAITGLAVKVTVPALAKDADGVGASSVSGVCPVTVTDVLASQSSAQTSGAYYTVLSE
ncbi:hypothetical protein AB0K00_01970 [Dactylosporangium sp. NPDC049525]|uniref:hypothetical protein n=1 Tax=Dactylosporangium sp. NPDC049525 TaxID=3154730 RepID=UPI00343969CC